MKIAFIENIPLDYYKWSLTYLGFDTSKSSKMQILDNDKRSC